MIYGMAYGAKPGWLAVWNMCTSYITVQSRFVPIRTNHRNLRFCLIEYVLFSLQQLKSIASNDSSEFHLLQFHSCKVT